MHIFNKKIDLPKGKAKTKKEYSTGLKDGFPIGIGYLPVAFSFGIMAVKGGIPILNALLISITNITSAGQVAGLTIMLAGGTFLEIALSQIIINLRYTLMTLVLSQKLEAGFSLAYRFLCPFFITDEEFAIAAAKEGELSGKYLLGLVSLPYAGWVGGTLLGAVAGELLPASIVAALGLAVYGMFIAIFTYPATKHLGVFVSVGLAIAISCAIKYIPVFSFVTQGFTIIIAGIASSVVAALIFPIKDDENDSENGSSTGIGNSDTPNENSKNNKLTENAKINADRNAAEVVSK